MICAPSLAEERTPKLLSWLSGGASHQERPGSKEVGR